MLNTKYIYKFTYVARVPNSITTSEYLMEPICFETDFFCDTLFEMSYGAHLFTERSKIFKVAPIRGETWLINMTY